MTDSKRSTATTARGPRRGPRRAVPGRRGTALPPLTREGIVAAALALVAEDGVSGLSTRKLGERLRCEAMSIYHHFPSKAHLLDALVDQVLASYAWPDERLAPLPRLRAAAHAYRELAHRYAAFFPFLAVHRLNTETGVRFIESILGCVHAIVGDAQKAARHFRVLGYYLVGAGLDETAGYARGPSAAEPVSDEHIAAHCPHLMAAAPYFQRAHWDATFEAGLEALIDAMLRDRSAARPGRTGKTAP